MIDRTKRLVCCAWLGDRARLWAALAAATLLVACDDSSEPEQPELPTIDTWVVGGDAGHGNMLGMQAWVKPADYASAETFERALRTWFEAARDLGMLHPDTVVVLPEYVGTWLVAVDEPDNVYRAATSTEALALVLAQHNEQWLHWQQDAPATDSATYGVFALKAERMAEVYQAVFSNLAADFATTIVAGSTILPEPEVAGGAIVVHPGEPLRNVAFVFAPDGSLLGPPVIKAFPTQTEQPFVEPGEAADLPVFETGLGRLAVLICADAWFPEAYDVLADQAIDAIAVPVFITGDGYWDAPWQGYSGYPEPSDVDPADIGVLTEGEAWHRYSLPGRIGRAGARAGMTVPLRGTLWDFVSDGHGMVSLDGQCQDAPELDAPLLINLWL